MQRHKTSRSRRSTRSSAPVSRTVHSVFTTHNQRMFTCSVTHQEPLEIQRVSSCSIRWLFSAHMQPIRSLAPHTSWPMKMYTFHTCRLHTPLNRLCKPSQSWLVWALAFTVVIHLNLLPRTCLLFDQPFSHLFQEFSIEFMVRLRTLSLQQLDAKLGLSIVQWLQNLTTIKLLEDWLMAAMTRLSLKK